MESGDKYDDSDEVFLPPLISEAKMDEILSGDESDAEPMLKYFLENIRDRRQYHSSINRREAHYKILDQIKQMISEWKGALLSTQSMGRGSHKILRLLLTNVKNNYQFWENQDQKFLTSYQNL